MPKGPVHRIMNTNEEYDGKPFRDRSQPAEGRKGSLQVKSVLHCLEFLSGLAVAVWGSASMPHAPTYYNLAGLSEKMVP